MLTVKEAADRLRTTEVTIRRWIKAGELVAHRLGAQLRVAESDVELFLRQRRGLR
jgi:excisionase family DNA binding protein